MVRIATVFGSSGEQGSSVVHAILKDGTFKPRVVTRNANSDSSRRFVELGAEVVQADSGDKESVKKAVAGAEVVFLVTFPFTATSEYEQGVKVIDASKEAGVRFLVFSTLPSLIELSKGKFKNTVHFEEKDKVAKYLQTSGLPYATIGTGWFLENLSKTNPLKQKTLEKSDDSYIFHAFGGPGMAYAVTWIEHDLGSAFVALATQYESRASEVVGQSFVVGSARPTVEDFAAELGKGLGKPVRVDYLGKSGIVPLDEMYESATELDWYPGVDLPDPRLEKLGLKVGTIEDFAKTRLAL
ncbi:hypothetical protein HDZ31DRAFT_81954 [Schizophyllum fasciatum]